jgi:hypothetical protein
VKTLLRSLTNALSQKSQKSRPTFRPTLEGLEERTVPTVTFHGGAVLPHVKVQALFLGVQWRNDPALYRQAQSLDGFLHSLVNSSYMDALTSAGYGVGRGSAAPAKFDRLPSRSFVVSTVVTNDIANGTLQFPDNNTLYICFVEPNVSMRWDDGSTSATVGGFHDAFALHISGVATPGRTVRVVTIAYPGGTVGNTEIPFLSTLDSMTATASRDIADAVTDPDGGYKTRGWFDDTGNGEVGDITTNRIAYIKGYAVQRVVNKDDFLMTPAQAGSNRAVNFVLQTNGNLVEVAGGGSTLLSASVAAVSDQGIDNQGRAVVDVVTTDGFAFEIHATGGTGTWVYLGSGVKSAKAGQGVSYVLYTSGDLYEFDDATAASRYVRGSVTQIDAGTDPQGVNAVDAIAPAPLVFAMTVRVAGLGGGIIFRPIDAFEYSDDSGAHFIASGVQSISAGRQGMSAYVTTGGDAWWFSLAGGEGGWLASGVSRALAGTDPNGAVMYDLLFSNSVVQEERAGIGWYTVANAVTDVTKGRLGAVDLVRTPDLVAKMSRTVAGLGGGIVYHPAPQALEHTLSGWRFLLNDATTAV